jgi:hypothetical protein
MGSVLGELRAWLSAAVDAPVEVAAPGSGQRGRLCVWPLALVAEQGTRGGAGREPLRLRARYLVAVDGPAEAAVELLDRLLAAVAADDRYPVLFEALAPAMWAALGTFPRPALVFELPVLVARERVAVPRVRQALRLEVAPLRTLQGRVLGPGGIPLSGVKVTAAGTATSAYTDVRGGFALPGVPGGVPALLWLSGRGLHLQAQVEPANADPVLIHCDLEEA